MAKKASNRSTELVFSDGKSNKFWSIDLRGSSYTITFGRAGTSGKSQEKNFGSADAAEKAFEKLVAEKFKKGYRSAAGDSKSDDSLKPKEKKESPPVRVRQKACNPKAGPTRALSTSDKAKVLKLFRERTAETARLAFASLASFELKPRDYLNIFSETALADLFKLKRGQTVADAFPFWECLLAETSTLKPLHSKFSRELGIKFSNVGDTLYLDGLTRLSDAAAESLSKYKGDLYLNGLTSLSDAAAESLSKHKNWLHLNGLESLSDAAAKSLSKHNNLDLSGKAQQAVRDFKYVDDVERPRRADPPGTITNSIGMKLIPIPAGKFLMGSPKKENGRTSYEVQHEVTLTKDFYIGMTQVTQAQYKKVMGENPSHFQGDEVAGRDSSEFPVDQVSWNDAMAFCKKLSSLPEEKKAGHVYRLPTEAEWEYACRAGTTTKYCFGDAPESLSDYAWYEDNSGDRPHPVALKQPNAWGLYDMHGNVEEWCADWYGEYPSGSMVDPAGPATSYYRVFRGGSWDFAAVIARSARRYGDVPALRNYYLGFRLALSSREIPE